MSYLKRRDGSIQLKNGQPVTSEGASAFVVVPANSFLVGVPSQDITNQQDFNEFVIDRIRAVAGYSRVYTADTQTYHATTQDYLDKFGSVGVAQPVSASSYDGYSGTNQSQANANALAVAKAIVISKLKYVPLPGATVPLPGATVPPVADVPAGDTVG